MRRADDSMRTGLRGVPPVLARLGIGRPAGQIPRRARPLRPVVPEYSSRGRDCRLDVQRARWNDGDAEIRCDSRHRAAAVFAEHIPESFRLRHCEAMQRRFAANPFGGVRFNDDVAGVACAVCFATALAMAMKKVTRCAGNFILHRSAQAASFEKCWWHTFNPLIVRGLLAQEFGGTTIFAVAAQFLPRSRLPQRQRCRRHLYRCRF